MKNNMFLCMILAQAQAIEAGVQVELQVARPARDGLELCDNLLKPREDTGAISSPDDAVLTDQAVEGGQGLVFEEFDRNLDGILSFRTPDSAILEP